MPAIVYSSHAEPGISRRRRGDGFAYLRPDGRPVSARDEARIAALGIPPAWEDVWICAKPNGHVQAVGRDARGRLQYRYHAAFRSGRESAKHARVLRFARLLPAIRQRVEADMALAGLPREKVLATVTHLLETTMIRIGNRQYAQENKTFGLSTLRTRHVKATGDELLFQFRGKSGKDWRVRVRDRGAARIVRACQELPGQHLFQYRDGEGTVRAVSSQDVNDYLRAVSGAKVTAKDFRTWGATVLCALTLKDAGSATSSRALRSQISAAVREVAGRLGNTPAICRACYIHPDILTAHADGGSPAAWRGCWAPRRRTPARRAR